MKKLYKKVAIVTGAANGIGLAICRTFAQQGATVIMADIDSKKMSAEQSSLTEQGFNVHSISCDVGHTKQVNALIEQTLNKHARIDTLVNNAAVALAGNVLDMSDVDWAEVLNVNLTSVFRTTRACLPHMIAQKSGSVINMSSIQAYRSWHNWTAYAAAKGAVRSMTNQLAGQFGHFNIRFNTISPGAILTPMNENRAHEEGESHMIQSIKMSPANRLGEAKEVANTALFLASQDSAFINGADIKIDGGLCTVPRYEECQS